MMIIIYKLHDLCLTGKQILFIDHVIIIFDIKIGGSGSDDLQYVQKILLTLSDCQSTLYQDYHIQVTEVMINAWLENIFYL